MKCPFCNSLEDKVVDSRLVRDGKAIRRRRECLECGQRYTTYEYIEQSPILVIKRDGRREEFQREKLLNGIRQACHKRPVPAEQVEEIVDKIEAEILARGENEISSVDIGIIVMKYLHTLDEVAYVRFASVYREFKDVEEFEDILKEVERLRNLEAVKNAQLPIFEDEKSN
ncbi:transcriptional regulator NrdR [bacterium]|nr:MAG: transcriptional regulator NrdR [bacterium]